MGTSLRIDCGPGSHIVFQDTENRILSENMVNHLMMVGLILLAGTTMTLSQTPPKDEDCPFGPGSCPVTLDNVVDVYFHDVHDIRPCQRECRQIEECHFFTMFPESDDPHDHMKCFLFKTCDHLEACDDCILDLNYPLSMMTVVITTMEITLAKQLWTMWLMYTILMLKILSPVKINVTCLMTAISGPFLMYKMLPNPITNAFCSKNAIFTNLVRLVKQDQKANIILEHLVILEDKQKNTFL